VEDASSEAEDGEYIVDNAGSCAIMSLIVGNIRFVKDFR
jgi:hypothetical protein